MDLETCKKYFGFVEKRCERFLEDGRVTDDELFQLINEFNRFKEQVAESDLSADLKQKVAAVHLGYTRSKMNKNRRYLMLAVATLGLWALVIWMSKQQRRNQTLENLKHDMISLRLWAQMQS